MFQSTRMLHGSLQMSFSFRNITSWYILNNALGYYGPLFITFMSYSYWWSWRHWRSHCLAMVGLSPRCPSLHPPPPPHHCQHTGPTCHHSRSDCWRWSWHSGCGREGSLQRRLMTHICNLFTISLSFLIVLVFTQSSIYTPAPSI